ncbi:MAG: uroporphyrinogen decarboxylase [Planctomycetales bacterium]|nr:uroporphyrinogen decarboxylase [Planctomycetales bacterium]
MANEDLEPSGLESDSPGQGLEGLRVASLESRRADEMRNLIERFGGTAIVAPSMQELPLDENTAAIDFAHQVLTGQVNLAVFLTGVGFEHLMAVVDRNVNRQRFLDNLSDIDTVARGPKPAVAMKKFGITPTYRVPEPNTWRELLELVDREQLIRSNQQVALLEYGKPNPSLVAGLEARGAHVQQVPIYRWTLPDDVEPLKQLARDVLAGRIDVLLVTSAQQIEHFLAVGSGRYSGSGNDAGADLEHLKRMLKRVVIASIGPTTSEALRERGLPVDLESSPPKMGAMLKSLAAQAQRLCDKKRRIHQLMSGDAENTMAPTPQDEPWYDSPFMRACRREPTDVTPIWLMRQAGRYMQEYREVRAKTTFLELCKNPELCSEVMCTAVERLGVDAAIIFSDLLPILEPMGFQLEFAHGEGPVIHNPVRTLADVDRVLELESMDALQFVADTVRCTRRDMQPNIPVIGFAGAPFTLASYAIEGGASRNYLHTKTLMYRDPGAWNELMERLSRAVIIYLNAQVRAGAQAVQLFDSWAGCLHPDDYRRYVLPHVKSIVQSVEGAPVINFATGNPSLLPLLAEADPAVVGVDWRIRLDTAWDIVGPEYGVQGNLDPIALMADLDELRLRAGDVLTQAGNRPGHIFNLGHGILPQTDVNQAIALVDMVHEMSSR